MCIKAHSNHPSHLCVKRVIPSQGDMDGTSTTIIASLEVAHLDSETVVQSYPTDYRLTGIAARVWHYPTLCLRPHPPSY